ncbi:PIN-like domain-containing protein [Pseudoalteromonas sp. MMG012]|uniref:PIN-like domain-containing protein n=1 Tax=Pseudoalteromonas sp. MMG012 TaxID=2822686 RepID=UPI001B39DE1D|nr:PIN-like domain-containing protein [Pseudoalteromonas sp. MMG012]MBQ4851929.1 DUF4935 domain-containing protein [Pseudoalteromonas sp. MMG012]
MLNRFPGFADDYLEEQILNSEKVTVVFDTNILLNLYRYEKKIVNDILLQIKSLKRNKFFDIWLPHQVALEFNLQRKQTFKTQEKAFQEFSKEFKTFSKKLDGLAKVGGKNSELSPLKKELGVHLDRISNVINKHQQKERNVRLEDKVIEQVFEIFEGLVGEHYSFEQMKRIEQEGEYRYSHNIPPGFDDGGKSVSYSYMGTKIESKYGDLILWNQLIDRAISSKNTLILVTGDEKSDWKSKEFDRVHPELINEFKLKTGQDFYSLTLPNFERHFKPRLKRKLSDATTNEIIKLNQNDNSGWLEDILFVFQKKGKPLTLKEVYNEILAYTDRELPPSWDVIIRRTIYNHCSDLKAFLGKRDLFIKLDSGKYGLR